MYDFIDSPQEDQLDSIPETVGIEYPCTNCGREAGPYRGRGRKPTKCETCKTAAPKSGTSTVKVSGKDANLAAQAATALENLNSLLAFIVMPFGLHATAGAISSGNPQFKEMAYQALLTDPELCRTIMKGGGVMSGGMMLGLAYASLGASVVPTAIMEVKEKRAAIEAARVDE